MADAQTDAAVGRLDETSQALEAAARLRAAGLRVTRPRVAVLRALARTPHADADALRAAAREELGAVSHQAVYDVLRALVRAGLVRRIEPAGQPGRFELRVGDNHHHVVCRGCGTAADVDCAVGEAPCLEPSRTHGFVLDEAEVTFWGLCPACQEAQGEGAPEDEPEPPTSASSSATTATTWTTTELTTPREGSTA